VISHGDDTGAGKPTWQVTRRSLLLGIVLVPLNVYWVIYAEYRLYNVLTLNPLFVTPVFYLFVLACVNAVLIRVARGCVSTRPRWS